MRSNGVDKTSLPKPASMLEYLEHQHVYQRLRDKVIRAFKNDDKSTECTQVVTYYSTTHKKHRYFTDLPNDESKTQFTYESDVGRLVTRETGKKVIELLEVIGYQNLILSTP